MPLFVNILLFLLSVSCQTKGDQIIETRRKETLFHILKYFYYGIFSAQILLRKSVPRLSWGIHTIGLISMDSKFRLYLHVTNTLEKLLILIIKLAQTTTLTSGIPRLFLPGFILFLVWQISGIIFPENYVPNNPENGKK